MRDTEREREREREREAETQAEGEAGSMQRARCRTPGSPGSRPGLQAALNHCATEAALLVLFCINFGLYLGQVIVTLRSFRECCFCFSKQSTHLCSDTFCLDFCEYWLKSLFSCPSICCAALDLSYVCLAQE